MKSLILLITLLASINVFAGKDCEDAVLLSVMDVRKAYIICNNVKDFCFNDVLITTINSVKSAQTCKNVKSHSCYDAAFLTTMNATKAATICKDVQSKCFDSVYMGDVKKAAKTCQDLD
jgi:hypothetical protein